jgi:hypothetical protein
MQLNNLDKILYSLKNGKSFLLKNRKKVNVYANNVYLYKEFPLTLSPLSRGKSQVTEFFPVSNTHISYPIVERVRTESLAMYLLHFLYEQDSSAMPSAAAIICPTNGGFICSLGGEICFMPLFDLHLYHTWLYTQNKDSVWYRAKPLIVDFLKFCGYDYNQSIQKIFFSKTRINPLTADLLYNKLLSVNGVRYSNKSFLLLKESGNLYQKQTFNKSLIDLYSLDLKRRLRSSFRQLSLELNLISNLSIETLLSSFKFIDISEASSFRIPFSIFLFTIGSRKLRMKKRRRGLLKRGRFYLQIKGSPFYYLIADKKKESNSDLKKSKKEIKSVTETNISTNLNKVELNSFLTLENLDKKSKKLITSFFSIIQNMNSGADVDSNYKNLQRKALGCLLSSFSTIEDCLDEEKFLKEKIIQKVERIVSTKTKKNIKKKDKFK